MKAYKGFNKDMTCRGFQYEEGKTYELPDGEEAKLCESRFHACEAPLDCFNYYAPATSVFHEVDLDEVVDDRSDDSKRVGRKLTVGAKLDVAGLVKAQFAFVKEHTTNEFTDKDRATAGEYGAATAGEYGAATAGYRGAATAGEYGAATAGHRGAATAGYRGAATAGDYGAATAGEYGAATAGYGGAATAGEYGAATSRGSSRTGENGISVARGNNVKVMGGPGAVIVLCEEEIDSYEIKEWKVAVVDGETIKPDTWYKLENGKIIEAEDL